jgi:hypothetical protein
MIAVLVCTVALVAFAYGRWGPLVPRGRGWWGAGLVLLLSWGAAWLTLRQIAGRPGDLPWPGEDVVDATTFVAEGLSTLATGFVIAVVVFLCATALGLTALLVGVRMREQAG